MCILLNERYGSNESKECECEGRGENEIEYKSLLLRRMDGFGQKRREEEKEEEEEEENKMQETQIV